MISRIAKITALFIIFLTVVGISAYLTLTFIIRSEDTVVVPALNGKDVVYVLKILTDLGLNTKVGGSEHSDAVPMNHVIYQEPEAGTEIKKGRDIRIIVSKGTRTILMPNLIGLPVQQARIILEENGLCQGKQSMTYSNRIKKDKIIAQVPGPGAMIKRTECVDMLMSMGIRPATYKMPNLTGRPVEEAILLIESYNLLLGDIKPIFHQDKPMNVIVRQDPLSGQRVTEGNIVNFEANRRPGNIEGKYL
ncbi:PASTA domain-containing protein, partial [Thermodesulfobacteriota bacterium]